LSYTFLPYFKATIVEEKLSSRRIISDALIATSVPVRPIENPTSASFKAGASFVPSPVTATTSPHYFIPVTRRSLSSGDDLPSTLNSLLIDLNFATLPTDLTCF